MAGNFQNLPATLAGSYFFLSHTLTCKTSIFALFQFFVHNAFCTEINHTDVTDFEKINRFSVMNNRQNIGQIFQNVFPPFSTSMYLLNSVLRYPLIFGDPFLVENPLFLKSLKMDMTGFANQPFICYFLSLNESNIGIL